MFIFGLIIDFWAMASTDKVVLLRKETALLWTNISTLRELVYEVFGIK